VARLLYGRRKPNYNAKVELCVHFLARRRWTRKTWSSAWRHCPRFWTRLCPPLFRLCGRV